MILISGASGFLGKAIANSMPKSSKGIVRQHMPNSIFEQIELDITDVNQVDAFIAKEKNSTSLPEAFIHCAAITPWGANPDYSQDIKMAKNVLRLCHFLKINKLIFISGWVVYDNTSSPPYNEANTPLLPSTPYGESKKATEIYLKQYSGPIQVLNLRLASIYGPGQNTPGLIPNVSKKALVGGDITLNAKSTKRDYLYIDDFVNTIRALLNTDFSGSEDINVGSGEAISIQEVGETISSAVKKLTTHHPAVLFSEPLNEGIPPDNTLEIEKARTLGLIKQLTPFDEGIKNYINWLKHENNL